MSTTNGPTASDAVTGAPQPASIDVSGTVDAKPPVTPGLAAKKASDSKLKDATATAAASAPAPEPAAADNAKSKCGKCAIL